MRAAALEAGNAFDMKLASSLLVTSALFPLPKRMLCFRISKPPSSNQVSYLSFSLSFSFKISTSQMDLMPPRAPECSHHHPCLAQPLLPTQDT
ncbi:mCG1044914 [Mus musculus]|nr:mCG1044914 [Mus musculus]